MLAPSRAARWDASVAAGAALRRCAPAPHAATVERMQGADAWLRASCRANARSCTRTPASHRHERHANSPQRLRCRSRASCRGAAASPGARCADMPAALLAFALRHVLDWRLRRRAGRVSPGRGAVAAAAALVSCDVMCYMRYGVSFRPDCCLEETSRPLYARVARKPHRHRLPKERGLSVAACGGANTRLSSRLVRSSEVHCLRRTPVGDRGRKVGLRAGRVRFRRLMGWPERPPLPASPETTSET